MGTEITIKFVRNYTVEPIGNAVQEAAQKLGLSVTALYGDYDNVAAELAALAASGDAPSIVIVSIDLDYFAGGIWSPKWKFEEVAESLNLVLSAVDTLPAASYVLLTTFIPPFKTSLPSLPGHSVFGRDLAASELNAMLREFAARRPGRCGIIDFERISARLGEAATRDKRFGLMMKAPFRQPFVEAAAGETLRFLRCRFLPPKKVLVLDCDNTLWGGVVGECGVEGIKLDPYEYPGIAYYRVQSEILSIAERGVLLCLCSKNDQSAVWSVLENHPHCLLRRDKLAGYRINWADKATNLKELAAELNLSLDSLVLVDDNPAECELVRSQLPEVTVIQVPAKIYEYPGIIDGSQLFDRISVNQEDKDRVRYYQEEKGRREFQTRHVDVEGFLRGLEMRAVVRPVHATDASRVAQLCQRTNQFNVTSKRYTESDVASLLDDPDVRMFVLLAEDRFGSLGQSGLVIFKRAGDIVDVDTFLMSCRIIGRQLDRALFCRGLELLGQAWSFGEIRAAYVSSKKNSVVAGLWSDYGFSRVSPADPEKFGCKVGELKVTFPGIIQLAEVL